MTWGVTTALAAAACAAACAAGGCSLTLDFSNRQIPIDAGLDAVYTQAECDFREPNETAGAAQPVTTADTGPAAICPDDVDFYSFVVPDGAMAMDLKILFKNRSTGDLDLKLFDATGTTTLGQSLGFTDNEEIVCPAMSPSCPKLTPGTTYAFEVFPAVAGDVNTYEISLGFTP